MTRYKHALTIELRHEYYDHKQFDVQVTPLDHTLGLLSGDGVLYRERFGGFELYCDVDREPPSQASLDFLIQPKATEFMQFTDPSWLETIQGERPTDAEIALFELTGESDNATASSANSIVSRPQGSGLSCSDHILRLSQQTLIEAAQQVMQKGQTRVIELNFLARKTRWRYLFPWLDDSANVEISDKTKSITFAADGPLQNGGQSFTSTKSLPLKNRQVQKFELKIDQNTVVPRLPPAEACWLRETSAGSDWISEIVVN